MDKQEQNIIAKLQKRDESGLRQLFDLYHTPLCVFALKYVNSFEEAEDIVQEVFIILWEKKCYSYISDSLRSYLFKAVKNNSFTFLRNSKRIQFEELGNLVVPTTEDSVDCENIELRKKLLYQELNKLSDKNRQVFEAIVFENQKYKEVALELDVSLNTVKTHFSRSLKQLRGSLDVIILILLP